MKYTEKETIIELNKELMTIEHLYKAKCVNWSGTTKNTDDLYTEVIAQELLKNLKEFDKIRPVPRTNTYFRDSHSKIEIDLESNRKEEIFAKRIAFLKFDEIGEIIDYQVPLKNTLKDKGLGKIDLISYQKDTKTLYLIELKYFGNKETLLRAALESYTYYKNVDKTKLIDDYFNNHKFILNKAYKSVNPEEFKVKPAVLVVPDCNAYKELEEMENGERPYLKALSLALGIKFFTLEFLVYENEL